MTINNKHLCILKNLVESGLKDEKQYASFSLSDAVKLPRCCRIDLAGVLECVAAVKQNKLLSYLTADTEEGTEKENGHETGNAGSH